MQFELSGKKYRLEFIHTYKPAEGEKARKPISTLVMLLDGEKPAFEDGLPNAIVSGVAICHKNDQFDRAKGRKTAMARMLSNSEFTKEQRLAIWDEYFKFIKVKYTIKRKPKKAKVVVPTPEAAKVN